MALVHCSECGREISTEAAACPGCGAPGIGSPAASTAAPESANSTSQQGAVVNQIEDPFGLALAADSLPLRPGTAEAPITLVQGPLDRVMVVVGVALAAACVTAIGVLIFTLGSSQSMAGGTAKGKTQGTAPAAVNQPGTRLTDPPPVSEAVTTPVSPTSIHVRGSDIRVGDSADDVFRTLKPADSVKKEVQPDAVHPGNSLVTHHYHVDGHSFSLTMGRNSDPGPYRVVRISKSSTEKAIETPSATVPKEVKADVVDCVDLRIYAKARNPDLGFFDLTVLVDSARRAGTCK